jgi:hypothetical protein
LPGKRVEPIRAGISTIGLMVEIGIWSPVALNMRKEQGQKEQVQYVARMGIRSFFPSPRSLAPICANSVM